MFDQSWIGSLNATTLLAVVAAIGYSIGLVRRHRANKRSQTASAEMARATLVARELECTIRRLQKALSAHVPSLSKFNSRMKHFDHAPIGTWHDLYDQTDALLKPTLRLGTEVSHAYSELCQQMSQLALFAELRSDPLTGACNRRAFDEALSSLVNEQSRFPAPLSVAMIDVDHFKQVNDQLGHPQGDRVLQKLSALLKANLRECDVLARYGGEEFAIIMPRTELHTACMLSERLRATVEAGLSVTISVGLASSDGSDTATGLVSRSDAALYTAKHAGRNCVYYHEGESRRIVGIHTAGDNVQGVDARNAAAPVAAPAENAVRQAFEPQIAVVAAPEPSAL